MINLRKYFNDRARVLRVNGEFYVGASSALRGSTEVN
jgi:hypothetical protein